MNCEEVDLAAIVPVERSFAVGSDAPRREDETPFPNPPRLALNSDESAFRVEDEVITMIDPERRQDAVSPADELREDDRLGALTHVDRMLAPGHWRWKFHGTSMLGANSGANGACFTFVTESATGSIPVSGFVTQLADVIP
jgi:hypothetical protein